MNNHPRPEELLTYLEDELQETERQAVESHLLLCSSCRDDLERLKRDLPKILEILREYCTQESPPAPRTWPSLEDLLKPKLSGSKENDSAQTTPDPDSE